VCEQRQQSQMRRGELLLLAAVVLLVVRKLEELREDSSFYGPRQRILPELEPEGQTLSSLCNNEGCGVRKSGTEKMSLISVTERELLSFSNDDDIHWGSILDYWEPSPQDLAYFHCVGVDVSSSHIGSAGGGEYRQLLRRHNQGNVRFGGGGCGSRASLSRAEPRTMLR